MNDITLTSSEMRSIPANVRRLIARLGVADTLLLSNAIGGVPICIPKGKQATKLNQYLPDRIISKLCEIYSEDDFITIPKCKRLHSIVIGKQIQKELKKGTSKTDIALMFGVHFRSIYRYLDPSIFPDAVDDQDARQMDLFDQNQ